MKKKILMYGSVFIVVIASIITGVLAVKNFSCQAESDVLLAEMTEALSYGAEVGDNELGSTCHGTYDIGSQSCRSICQSVCYVYKSTGVSRKDTKCDDNGNIIGYYTEMEMREEQVMLDVCRMVPKTKASLYNLCNDYRSCSQAGGTKEPHEDKTIWQRVN